MLPIQKAKLSAEEPKANRVERHLRHPGLVTRSDIAPATFFLVFLREMVKKRFVMLLNLTHEELIIAKAQCYHFPAKF